MPSRNTRAAIPADGSRVARADFAAPATVGVLIARETDLGVRTCASRRLVVGQRAVTRPASTKWLGTGELILRISDNDLLSSGNTAVSWFRAVRLLRNHAQRGALRLPAGRQPL